MVGREKARFYGLSETWGDLVSSGARGFRAGVAHKLAHNLRRFEERISLPNSTTVMRKERGPAGSPREPDPADFPHHRRCGIDVGCPPQFVIRVTG